MLLSVCECFFFLKLHTTANCFLNLRPVGPVLKKRRWIAAPKLPFGCLKQLVKGVHKFGSICTPPQPPKTHSYFFSGTTEVQTIMQCYSMYNVFSVISYSLGTRQLYVSKTFSPVFSSSSVWLQCLGVLSSINAAAVINEGTPGRREPYTEWETVWIGGSPNQWQIPIGMQDDLIQIIQSVVIRLTLLTFVKALRRTLSRNCHNVKILRLVISLKRDYVRLERRK